MKFSIKRQNATHFLKASSVVVLMLLSGLCFAQKSVAGQEFTKIDKEPFADNTHHWYDIFDKSNVINPLADRPQYKETDISNIADNILLFQKINGGWPKNYDFFAILTQAQKDSVMASKGHLNTTYDNGSTYTQIAALAIAYKATKKEKYKIAALKGLDFILKSQYKNGGWPQYYPIEENNYSSHITFNDNAFLGIMQLIKDIQDGQSQYDFINSVLHKKLENAYNKGFDCIIKTQINDAGKPTAWCQQYDEVTLKPAWARKFEPASICNKESSDLVIFLMSIDHPSKKIIDAVQNAVVWFQDSKIYNTREKTIKAPRVVTPYRVSETDKIVLTDSTAPPIWTRYYELNTHRPIFCDRNSKIVYTLAEVSRERRAGYGWYLYSPQEVLDKYPEWRKKWAVDIDVLKKK
jgi:PelA/Pel-15E family pectate lyase